MICRVPASCRRSVSAAHPFIIKAHQRVVQHDGHILAQRQPANGQPHSQIDLIGSSAAEIQQLPRDQLAFFTRLCAQITSK